MKRIVYVISIFIAFYILFLSYAFLDVHISLAPSFPVESYLVQINAYARNHRPEMTTLWLLACCALSACYVYILKTAHTIGKKSYKFVWICIATTAIILAFAYPATSYDLFNYITTAKVTYYYKENPYIVMPVEFTGEPYLAFTRAANKTALYGPVWILITAVPYMLGGENIWATIITFKLLNTAVYLLFLYCIFRITRSMKNVLFFAFNPLVLLEVLVSGHNDIYMMIFSLSGIYLWWHNRKISGFFLFFLSWFIKGMTITFLPLLFFRNKSWEHILRFAYWVALFVFFVFAPLREELYPWYAIWFISIASLMNFETNRFIYSLTVVLSLTLELRHLPYMWMGYYEGPGPMLRMLITGIPVCIFLLIYPLMKYKQSLSVRI